MRIESRAIKLSGVGVAPPGGPQSEHAATFQPPEDAQSINGNTVHTPDGFVLLVTWLVPTTEDERAEVAARKAQVRAAAGGLLMPTRGMG